MKIDRLLLFPYTIVLGLRHLMYDRGILRSYPSALPSICVGNITVGGTGKTPAVEMLVRMYRGSYRIAVVSRGYGRRTKGFRIVAVDDDYRDVGDEPLQIKRKFPDITVVVDSSRKRAVDMLAAMPGETRPGLVILDDAFQHRRLRSGFSIVLVSSSRPVFKDCLLPIGRLRDLPCRLCKADMVIVTKVEGNVDDAFRRKWRTELGLPARIPLLFSRISYLDPVPVFHDSCDGRYVYSRNAVLFSGIADNRTLKREVGWRFGLKEVLTFADHHDYGPSDFSRIAAAVRRHPTAMVVTTEKDAQRLVSVGGIPDALKARMFYIPIVSEMIPDVDERHYIQEELPAIGLEQLKEKIIIR